MQQTRDGYSAGVQKCFSNAELWQIVTSSNSHFFPEAYS